MITLPEGYIENLPNPLKGSLGQNEDQERVKPRQWAKGVCILAARGRFKPGKGDFREQKSLSARGGKHVQ